MIPQTGQAIGLLWEKIWHREHKPKPPKDETPEQKKQRKAEAQREARKRQFAPKRILSLGGTILDFGFWILDFRLRKNFKREDQRDGKLVAVETDQSLNEIQNPKSKIGSVSGCGPS